MTNWTYTRIDIMQHVRELELGAINDPHALWVALRQGLPYVPDYSRHDVARWIEERAEARACTPMF